MCTKEVQLPTRECAHKMFNSQYRKGSLARIPNVHTRGPTLHTGKAIWQDFRMCTQMPSKSQHDIGIWKDFRMCTQDVQLSTRDSSVGKTSECAYKMSNSPHGVSNLARLRNMHTRGPTLNT
ncbi:hypothetical protein PoB_002417300 [Plakobranchus ocellatus]|uniref:Uncharacterized protein n=1 Tax=Plakobranchus ocellatus TaxID=259542 RepID=A0AAV3ZS44_9GAST|nr:hypothetical protein PoB_002417300 [Plakobranchus ocellatus]